MCEPENAESLRTDGRKSNLDGITHVDPGSSGVPAASPAHLIRARGAASLSSTGALGKHSLQEGRHTSSAAASLPHLTRNIYSEAPADSKMLLIAEKDPPRP
jgi:hypothetical protein